MLKIPAIFFSSTLIFLLLLGTSLNAQYSENVVQKPGLVRLNTNIVAEDYLWFVYYPPQTDFVKTNNGKTCVFAACQTGVTYSVALTAINYTDKSSIQKIFFVEISGNGPNPPPPDPDPDPPNPPDPPPGPVEPVFPDGTYKLAKFTYDNAPKGGNNITLANNLANNFQTVSSSIAAGVITSINNANSDLKTRNQATFAQHGSTPPEWAAFFTKFSEKMNSLFAANQLITVQDLRTAFQEIEQGLREVK